MEGWPSKTEEALSRAPGKATVDVVMPTLDGSSHLAEALESVFAQTLARWRLIVSENGPASADVSASLSPYRADERVQHHVVGTLVTMAENWTRAIRYTDAPYVAMLHDDDRWHPRFLERRVAFMEEHPTCGFVFGGYRAVDDDGGVLRSTLADLPEGLYPSAAMLPILFDNCLVTPPTALVRASAYEALGAEYREVFLTDYDLWLRLAARFDVGFLAVVDADYRYHGAQNTSRHRTRMGAAKLEVLDANEDLLVPHEVRRRARGEAHLLCAIDDAELGRRRDAVRHLRAALRSYPPLILRPATGARVLLALLAVALGAPGRRAFAALRFRRFVTHMGGRPRCQNPP
jgi:hypothetical protein